MDINKWIAFPKTVKNKIKTMYKGNIYNTPSPSLGFISNHIRNMPGKKEINKEHSWNITVNK